MNIITPKQTFLFVKHAKIGGVSMLQGQSIPSCKGQ